MTKHELAKELAVSEKLHLSTAVKAVDGIVRIIKESLTNGEDIFIRGFGTLAVVQREEKAARHFATGEMIMVPAHKNVRFKPSTELKNLLNDGAKH